MRRVWAVLVEQELGAAPNVNGGYCCAAVRHGQSDP